MLFGGSTFTRELLSLLEILHQIELSNLTTTFFTVHPSPTHPDTMASKSAVPSHLKAENGSDRHHGKTQSHVVCTEHAFFSISPCRFGAGKGGSSSRMAIGNRARYVRALERAAQQETAIGYCACNRDMPDSGTSLCLIHTSGQVDASIHSN